MERVDGKGKGNVAATEDARVWSQEPGMRAEPLVKLRTLRRSETNSV